jgi:hypothetical protein
MAAMALPMIDRRAPLIPPPNNTYYLIAVVVMAVVGVVACVLIAVLRPDKDNAALITSVAGFIAPTTLSLLAFMKSNDTHLSVNGRLEKYLSSVRIAAHADGVRDGQQSVKSATEDFQAELAAIRKEMAQRVPAARDLRVVPPTPPPAAPSTKADDLDAIIG